MNGEIASVAYRGQKTAWICALIVVMMILAVGSARADQTAVSYNTQFTPAFNVYGPASAVTDIGWFWTAPENFSLTEVQTEFNSAATASTGGADRDVTISIFNNIPVSGGTLLGSETFNSSVADSMLGGSDLNAPVNIVAGQTYFIGLFNVAGLGVNIACGGASLGAPGCENATAFGPPSLGGAFSDGGDGLFDSGAFGTPGSCLGLDCPIFAFDEPPLSGGGGGGGTVVATPEPSSLLLLGSGTGLFALLSVYRRRAALA